jgi:hypothetical protein
MTRKPAAFAEVIHGQSRHPLYGTWYAMMRRCGNPQDGGYKDYGGRGIKVCDRWHDVALFIADIEREIGPRPPGVTGKLQYFPAYTLDRIDVNGNYEPGNVQWATATQQSRNRREPKQRKRPDWSALFGTRASAQDGEA